MSMNSKKVLYYDLIYLWHIVHVYCCCTCTAVYAEKVYSLMAQHVLTP